MRVVIISSDGYLDKRIQRILKQSDINGDIKNKLTRNMLNLYDCIVYSYKNEIPNLPKVIESLVLERKVLVIYINNKTSIGSFYNVLNDMYFSMLNEMSLEFELPIILRTTTKYIKKINQLQIENTDLSIQLTTLKLTNKAKRILIKKGLSEDESHQYIQKKAMDLRITKRKLVNLIIENKIDI
jgi:response regulator NasT